MALGGTLDLCRLAELRPFVVLNVMRPGSTRVETDARESLARLECEVCPVALPERVDYRAASINGRTAQQVDRNGRAAAEIAALYDWLCQQLDNTTTKKRKKEATR